MKTILTLCALAITASLAIAAEGDRPKKPGAGDRPQRNPEEAFKALDKDGNGSISKAEFEASPMAKENAERATKMFEMKDKDKNGELSKEEFAARPEGGRPGKPGAKPEQK